MKKCPLCGSTRSTIYDRISGWRLCLCSECSLLRTDILSKSNSVNINREVYNESYSDSYKLRKNELKVRFKKYLDTVEIYKNGGTVLDIGCGLGYFIEVVNKSSLNWDAYGLELNKHLASEANMSLKGKVKIGSLSRIPFKDKFFDCITCFDVLEHSLDINTNLNNLFNALNDDGIVVIQSPNYKSLMQYITGNVWDWWAIPDHVLHFSPETLRTALEKNNFELLQINTYEPLSDFIGNIKQLARKNIFTKALFVICLPFLLIGRFIAHKVGYGGLIFAVARKKII